MATWLQDVSTTVKRQVPTADIGLMAVGTAKKRLYSAGSAKELDGRL
jgi:hypothetical protein